MIKLPFRIRYFLSHLLISLIVASFSLWLIFGYWYPAPFYNMLGIGGLAFMMLAIDVILGPILTLLIAKEGKKSLKMDLTVIALVQVVALAYGLYSINKGRPVALAFDINRFEIALNYNLDNEEKREIVKRYADEQHTKIPFVAVRPAKDEAEYQERIKNELENNILSSANPQLYEGVADNFDIIQAKAKPVTKLTEFNDEALVKPVLAKYPQADKFLPIVGSAKSITVLIDTKNKTVVDIVELRPW